MDRVGLLGGDRTLFIYRLAQHVDQAPQRLASDRHRNWRSHVLNRHAPDQAIGRGHGDPAHAVLSQVLSDLEGKTDFWLVSLLVLFLLDSERVIDIGELSGRKLDVHHGPNHLDYFSGTHVAPLCASYEC